MLQSRRGWDRRTLGGTAAPPTCLFIIHPSARRLELISHLKVSYAVCTLSRTNTDRPNVVLPVMTTDVLSDNVLVEIFFYVNVRGQPFVLSP